MSFSTVDLYSGQVKSNYDYVSEDLVLKSVNDLYDSYLTWKKKSTAERQDILIDLARRLNDKKDLLAQLITSEMGKPIKQSQLEVAKCITTVERACKDDLSFLNSRRTSSGSLKSEIQHEALGVIYAIMPWNFPIWQVIRMVIPALLSGNTVLLKHSEITPLIAQAIHELFDNIHEKPILINNYVSHDLTDYILKNPHIGGVSLTGSVAAGKVVYETAARYFKKVVLELGGSDPYLVLSDADLGMAAKKICKGRLLNNGQSCISAKRAIVHKSVLEPLMQLLKSEFSQYTIGDPADVKTEIGPLAHTRFKKSLKQQLEDLKKHTDATLIFSKPHQQSEKSAFVDTEIYLLTKNSDWLKDQEFFAPILLIIPFEADEEAVQIANSTDFALGAGVFSQNPERAQSVARALVAGQVVINDLIATDLSLPFGGFKSSGIGRELGRESYFEFTQTKVISQL